MNELYRNKYRIPSARAPWHDYNGGIYYVTMCTKNRDRYFGEIEMTDHGNIMHESPIAVYANWQLTNVEMHYDYCKIPQWIVMPDHIHAIIVIDRNKIPREQPGRCVGRDVPWNVSTWLAVVVRQFKQSISRYAKDNNISFGWQLRFYDRIIRNNTEYDSIVNYISTNVVRWQPK